MCSDAAARVDDDRSRHATVTCWAIELGCYQILFYPLPDWPSRYDFDVAGQRPRFIGTIGRLSDCRGREKACKKANDAT